MLLPSLAGGRLGGLAGVPFTVKENIDVAGSATAATCRTSRCASDLNEYSAASVHGPAAILADHRRLRSQRPASFRRDGADLFGHADPLVDAARRPIARWKGALPCFEEAVEIVQRVRHRARELHHSGFQPSCGVVNRRIPQPIRSDPSVIERGSLVRLFQPKRSAACW